LDKVFCQIGDKDEKVRAKKAQILRMPESQRRNELIEVGHLVQSAVEGKNKVTANAMMSKLEAFSPKSKQNKTLGDAMVLNAAFLVDQKKQPAFDQAIEALDIEYGDQLLLKYVGPVPPFNFVEIVIKWNEESAIPKEEVKNVSAG